MESSSIHFSNNYSHAVTLHSLQKRLINSNPECLLDPVICITTLDNNRTCSPGREKERVTDNKEMGDLKRERAEMDYLSSRVSLGFFMPKTCDWQVNSLTFTSVTKGL